MSDSLRQAFLQQEEILQTLLPILMTQEVIWIALLRHAGKNTGST